MAFNSQNLFDQKSCKHSPFFLPSFRTRQMANVITKKRLINAFITDSVCVCGRFSWQNNINRNTSNNIKSLASCRKLGIRRIYAFCLELSSAICVLLTCCVLTRVVVQSRFKPGVNVSKFDTDFDVTTSKLLFRELTLEIKDCMQSRILQLSIHTMLQRIEFYLIMFYYFVSLMFLYFNLIIYILILNVICYTAVFF